LTPVAHLAQGKLLLCLHVAANLSVLAVGLATLGQFVVLATVQAIDLVIEIVFQLFARVWQFRFARGKYSWHSQQEGPD